MELKPDHFWNGYGADEAAMPVDTMGPADDVLAVVIGIDKRPDELRVLIEDEF